MRQFRPRRQTPNLAILEPLSRLRPLPGGCHRPRGKLCRTHLRPSAVLRRRTRCVREIRTNQMAIMGARGARTGHRPTMGGPSYMVTLTPSDVAIILVGTAATLLITAGGIVIMTPAGRDWLLRRTAPSSSREAVHVQAGRIRVLAGALAGMEVPIPEKLILGRDPAKAQIVFPRDDT